MGGLNYGKNDLVIGANFRLYYSKEIYDSSYKAAGFLGEKTIGGLSMFAIYQKSVGGRVVDRYFKDYSVAKTELKKAVAVHLEWMKRECGYEPEVLALDIKENGIDLYEYRYKNFEGEEVVHSIVDGYFEDEPNE